MAGRVLGASPFPTGWEEFRPEPDWPLPRFPQDWRPRVGTQRQNGKNDVRHLIP